MPSCQVLTVTTNKTKYFFIEDELKKLKTFDLS